MTRMKNWLRDILTVFISLLVILGILEIAIRVFVKKERWRFKDSSSDFMSDSILGWKHRNNYSTINYDIGIEPIKFSTNEDGLRPQWIKPQKKNAHVFRILLVGNSTVAARWVTENQTPHYYLDSILRAKGIQCEVINAGVEIYSTDQAYLFMKRLLPKYKPDLILYGFCENDIGGNLDGQNSGFYKPFFTLSNDSVLVYHPLTKFNSLPKNFNSPSVFRNILRNSALWRFIRPYAINIINAQKSKNENILVMGLSPEVYIDTGYIKTIDFRLFDRLLVAMKSYCDSNHTRFGVYAHPSILSVWKKQQELIKKKYNAKIFNPYASENKIRDICQFYHVEFIPFVNYFLKNQQIGPFHLPGDPHCNGVGYKLQAECISNFVINSTKKLNK